MRTIRPSCTATTEAFGELSSSISCRDCCLAPAPEVAAAAAAAGDSGAVEPGVPAPEVLADLPGRAVALAVALEAEAGSGFQATFLPVSGSRPSIRPVSVAITPLG